MEFSDTSQLLRWIAEPSSAQEAEAILQQMARAVSSEDAELASLSAVSSEAKHGRDTVLPGPSAADRNVRIAWGKKTFESLLEVSPDALVVSNQDGRIALVNAQTEALFGYRRDELLGQSVEFLFPERPRHKHVGSQGFFAEPGARAMGNGLELSGRRKDGQIFPVEISLIPLETEDGLLVTSTVRDISDRKRLEARYRTLVEGIPAVTFMAALDEGNNEFYVSPQIEQLLGFSQKEWLGDPFLWFRQLHPDDRQRWGEEFARTCSSGVSFSSEYRFISRDGREVWVHGEARVIRDEHGQPLFLQGIAFDITKSKRAEETLRRSADELEHKVQQRTAALEEATLRAELANRARASFLANMSHEIRTPLNGIIGFADLLRRGAENGEAERMEWLEIVHGGGRHLLALINDILDLSKIDAGKINVEQADCSPVKIVKEVCSILRSKASEKGLLLTVQFDGPMPQTIRTDPTRLRQVLMNVAGNAIKFTKTGQVEITARLDRSYPDDPKLVVQIADTGIGIPTDKLGAIFDPFTQADSSITRQFGGTGLGLAISRRLAEALGGGVTVQSELGHGTTFTCEFATGSLGEDAPLENPDNSLTLSELPQLDAAALVANRRVLVVDDGDTNRKLIKLLLGRSGARVEEAENGRQGVERAMAEPFDVILMDMQMPVLDGYSATEELRRRGVQVPIIALTANAMKGDEERCRRAGCSGYLSKPIDQRQLFATVAAAVVGNEAAAPLAADREPPSTPPAISPPPNWQNKLVSTLPADDADFREIVAQFAERLREKLSAMQAACEAGDLLKLADLAHWLKGTGGGAGFPALTGPATHLEQLAREGRQDGIREAISQLQQLADRVIID